MTDDTRIKLKRILRCSDFNDMIKETFGREWDAQQSGEFYANGTTIYCEVASEKEDPHFIKESLDKIEKWKKSKKADCVGRESDEEVHMEFEEFLAGLCHHGILDPGPILIDISW